MLADVVRRESGSDQGLLFEFTELGSEPLRPENSNIPPNGWSIYLPQPQPANPAAGLYVGNKASYYMRGGHTQALVSAGTQSTMYNNVSWDLFGDVTDFSLLAVISRYSDSTSDTFVISPNGTDTLMVDHNNYYSTDGLAVHAGDDTSLDHSGSGTLVYGIGRDASGTIIYGGLSGPLVPVIATNVSTDYQSYRIEREGTALRLKGWIGDETVEPDAWTFEWTTAVPPKAGRPTILAPPDNYSNHWVVYRVFGKVM